MESGLCHLAVQAAPSVFPVYAAVIEEPAAFLSQQEETLLLDRRRFFVDPRIGITGEIWGGGICVRLED